MWDNPRFHNIDKTVHTVRLDHAFAASLDLFVEPQVFCGVRFLLHTRFHGMALFSR
jgi:hypothetical protein